MTKIEVGIVMGSESDLPIMRKAKAVLTELGVGSELRILSAHRTPEETIEYARTAVERGVKVFIAGAGGAAHLPGVIAGLSVVPVIGVPIKSAHSIDGLDSLLSIVQMPSGVPVATVAIDGAKNAGILAAQIIGVHDQAIEKNLKAMKVAMKEKVLESNEKVKGE